ncbi:MAG TPA: tetratricopeptide repeat protein [Kofleriaceae bacterium]|nr:tetratricopeptide repeat protein [Kofleriaceae bacterium]
MRFRLEATCIAAITLLLAGRASADRPGDREFERGLKLMQKGDIAEACAAFAESQRLDPQYGTEFNLGQCYQKLGRLSAALEAYQDVGRRDPNVQRRDTAAKLAADLEPRVPKLQIQIDHSPATVAVTVDGGGRSVAIDPGKPFPVDPGEYTVTARGNGQEAHVSVVIRGDERLVAVPLAFETATAQPVADDLHWITLGPTLGLSAADRYGLRADGDIKVLRGWRFGPALAISQGEMPESAYRKATNVKLVALAGRILTVNGWQVRPVVGAGLLLTWWRYDGDTDRVPALTGELTVLVGRKFATNAAWAVGPTVAFVSQQEAFGLRRGGFEVSVFAAIQLGI